MSKKRILVIGDIHGSAKALTQCLDRANVTEDDVIIQLGDVADGWSETSECVDILLDLQKTNECHFIRGNHDVWVYDWFNYGRQPIIWTTQGGDATIDSYIKSQNIADLEHKKFWDNQKDYYIDNQNRLFIHAGWYYIFTTFEEGYKMPVNAGSIAKECHWDRDIWLGAKSGHRENSFKATKRFNEVYIGHTALTSKDLKLPPQPQQACNVWNLDTGCGWNGVLTIMDIDTKEYWQSDFSKNLYPDEKGR